MARYEVKFPDGTRKWGLVLDKPIFLEPLSSVLCLSYSPRTNILKEIEVRYSNGEIATTTEINHGESPPSRTILTSAPADLYTRICAAEDELKGKSNQYRYETEMGKRNYDLIVEALQKAQGKLKPARDSLAQNMSFDPGTFSKKIEIDEGSFKDRERNHYTATLTDLVFAEGKEKVFIERTLELRLEDGRITVEVKYWRDGELVHTNCFHNLINNKPAVERVLEKYMGNAERNLVKHII